MKKEIQTNTRFIVLLVFVIILTTSLFTTCGDEEEQPKNQSATITGLFDNNSSATVKGYLTDTEWIGIADKIKTALNEAFTAGGMATKNRFRDVFTFGSGVTIILEKNPTYANWKTVGDTVTMFLNFDALDNDLQSKLNAAVTSMNDGGIETANVIQINNNVLLIITFFA